MMPLLPHLKAVYGRDRSGKVLVLALDVTVSRAQKRANYLAQDLSLELVEQFELRRD
jgi:hypothetical protein